MDTQIRWLRQWMGPRLLTRFVIEFLVLTNVLFVLFLVLGIDRVAAAAAAIVVGQLMMVVRVAVAFATNPASYGYLRRYTAVPAWSRVVETDTSTAHNLASFFANHNMSPDRAVAITTNDGTSSVDVFVSGDGYVAGVASADSDLPVVVSGLSDGRFLITSQQVVPVHEALVVNNVRRATPRQLLESHVEVLEVLHERGVSPARSGSETVALALALAHDAWSQLGAYYGPFLAFGARWRPLLLLVRVPSEALLDMGLRATGAPLIHGAPTMLLAEDPDEPATPKIVTARDDVAGVDDAAA